jgi:hypothetical protein
VSSKSLREPIDDCGELHEAEKGRCKLVVAGADPTESLDAAEEVFDMVT